MLNLELIKVLPQPRWALTPWLNNPPTISMYRKDPHKYAQHVTQSGVYSIEVNDKAIHYWGDEFLIINDPDWWAWVSSGKTGPVPWKSDNRVKIFLSNITWIESLKKRTITISGDVIRFIGVFEKNGSVIGLNTLHEEAIACV